MARRPTDTAELKLRLPERLRRLIERQAEKSNRSLNAEMVHRLEQSFSRAEIEEIINATLDAALERLNIKPAGSGSEDKS